MNLWHDINPERVTNKEFLACIEISKNSKMKYELDKETGHLILDRVLYTSTHYPANYGFIPKTLSEDGDPLDVLVLCQEQIIPLCLVKCRPIGVIKMIDGDSNDEKIVSVPVSDPDYNCYDNIDELPAHILDEMRHFFLVYKELEGKKTSIVETRGPKEAERIVQKSIDAYNEKYGNRK